MSTLSTDAALSGVQNAISKLRKDHFTRLNFSSSLEEKFEVAIAVPRTRRLRIEGLTTILLYNLLLVADYQALPGHFYLAVFVRLCVFTPLALACYAILWSNPTKFVRESTIVILAGTAAVTTFYLYSGRSAVVSIEEQIALFLILLFTNVLMRLRFPYAVASTIFFLVTDALFLASDKQLNFADDVHTGTLVFLVAVLILGATYSLEREERLSYLLQLRYELQAEQLEAVNRKLETISSQDSLTGLANRGAFDRTYCEMWEKSQKNGAPLSVVMIDIDHFKIVNDLHGHLYGDEVIQRVSALIKQGLRGPDDFAARYGGEEFVLLLPATSHIAAMKVAERIRLLIQVAGSPPPRNPTPEPGLWTTVSCGVATSGHACATTSEDLLQAADSALYAAKSNGRNCVQSAMGINLPSPV